MLLCKKTKNKKKKKNKKKRIHKIALNKKTYSIAKKTKTTNNFNANHKKRVQSNYIYGKNPN
jgi:hypothetical protein